MAELGLEAAKIFGSAEDVDPEKKITVEMLDFEYIKECKDISELRGIVSVLKSGKEGSYPHLLKAAEEKLLSTLSEKDRQKYLRLNAAPTPSEISEAEAELMTWESSINKTDDILRTKNEDGSEVPKLRRRKLPGVRGQADTGENLYNINQTSVNAGKKLTSSKGENKDENQQRLSGYDFRAWEKFDVDAALENLNNEEDVETAIGERYREVRDQQASRRLETHNQQMENLRIALEADSLSETEKKLRAVREKEKGNECFKAGELDIAINHYSRSICLNPSNAIVYANRALVSLKLQKYQDAEDDCTMSLEIDPKYIKSWVRRATTRFNMGKYAESIDDLLIAKRIDPGNLEVAAQLRKSEMKFEDVEGRKYIPGCSACRPIQGGLLISCKSTMNDFTSTVKEIDLVPIAAGMCKMKDIHPMPQAVAAKNIPVPIKSKTKGDFIPSKLHTGHRPCYVYKTGEEGLGYYYDDIGAASSDFAAIPSVSPPPPPSDLPTGFTRIPIAVDEDDDDEDEGNTPNVNGVNKMNRIVISEDSDNEGEHSSKEFTRINIIEEEEEEDVTALNLQEAERLKHLGNECMNANNFEDAVSYYTDSIKCNPTCLAAFNNRAMAYLKLQRYKLSVNDATTVIDFKIKHPDFDKLYPKALFRRAQAYFALGVYDAAIIDVDSILALDPHNMAALTLRQEISTMQTVSSTSGTEKSRELEIKNLRTQALEHLAQGQCKEAVMVLDILTTILEDQTSEPDIGMNENDLYSSTLLLLGKAHGGSGNHSNAMLAYDKLVKHSPKNFKAYLRRGEAKFRTGDLKGAKGDVLFALRLDPINSEALQLADMIAEENDKSNELKENKARDIISEMSEDNRRIESERLKNLGNEAAKTNKLQEAIKLYTKAIEIFPRNLTAINNRAQLYLNISRFVDADKDADTVIKMVDEDICIPDEEKSALKVKALFRRGLARRSMGGKGDLETASADFSAILKMEPSNSRAAIEKTRTEQLVNEQKKTAIMNVQKEATSKPTEPSNMLFSEVRSTRKVAKAAESNDDEQVTPSKEASVESSVTSPLPKASPLEKKTVNKISPSKISPRLKVPAMPTELPKTVYELERVWRGLKGHPDLFAQYLISFKTSTFKKVFNDNVSSDLLSSVFNCTKNHICRDSPSDALRIIDALTLMPKFELTVSLIPEEDLNCIRAILSELSAVGIASTPIIKELESKYQLFH